MGRNKGRVLWLFLVATAIAGGLVYCGYMIGANLQSGENKGLEIKYIRLLHMAYDICNAKTMEEVRGIIRAACEDC